VHVLSSAPPGSAWTFGASILTFAFPMFLFIAVACALYVLYTKPELIPGHQIDERPVSYTPLPGRPQATAPQTGDAAEPHGDEAASTEAGQTEVGE
jgi:hypothetical protein